MGESIGKIEGFVKRKNKEKERVRIMGNKGTRPMGQTGTDADRFKALAIRINSTDDRLMDVLTRLEKLEAWHKKVGAGVVEALDRLEGLER